MSRPKINRDYVIEYLRTEEHKRQLDAQSRNLGKLLAVMKEEMIEHVTVERDRFAIKKLNIAGFDVAIEMKKSAVSWSQEFVKACGAAAADALRAAAKLVPRLVVTPTTPAAQRDLCKIKEEAAKR